MNWLEYEELRGETKAELLWDDDCEEIDEDSDCFGCPWLRRCAQQCRGV